MNSKDKNLFKNIGILTISNFSSKILVFLLVPLYTSVLSTSEYGIYDIVFSTIQLLYPILTINISDAVMRFSMDKSIKKEEIASIGFRYIVGSCIIVTSFMIIAKFFHIFDEIEGMEIVILLYYVAYVANQFLIQFAKGVEKVTCMGIAGVIGTIVMIGFNVLFLVVIPLGLKGFFIANMLAQLTQAIYLFWGTKFWKYVKLNNLNKKLQNNMLYYCAPLIFTTLGWWINNTSDRYVVTFICGVAANGLLSVAYKIPQILNTLQAIFVQAWQISAIKEYGEKETSIFYGKYFLVMNFFMCVACSILIFLSKPIAYILYAEEFYEAWRYVPFLLISCVLNSASGFLGPILSAKKDSKSMAMSAIYGASINIILNIMLVYLIGIQGATIATVVSSYVIYVVRKRAVGKEIEIEQYTNVLIMWGLLCVQAFIEVYSSLWGVEIVLMMLILLINKNQISSIFKMFLNKICKN